MITVLAQTAYQEQLPYFDKSTGVRLTRLTYASIPGGLGKAYKSAPAGFRPGYLAVTIVTAFHLVLVAVIMYLFLRREFVQELKFPSPGRICH